MKESKEVEVPEGYVVKMACISSGVMLSLTELQPSATIGTSA